MAASLEDFMGYDVWVAMRLPYGDGSGDVAVLGVFSSEEAAQARCFIELEASSLSKECVAVVSREFDLNNADDYDNDDRSARQAAFDRLKVRGI